LAVLPVVLLAGCVKPNDPGIAVKALQADIVFGVQPPPEAAPPSVQPTVIEIEEGAPPELPAPAAKRPTTGRPALPPCVDALETAFPETAATNDVTNLPEAGRYRWKVGGAVTVNGVRIPLGGFANRTIQNISSVTTSPNNVSDPPNVSETKTFTFEVAADLQDGGKQVVTYEVRNNPQQQTATVPGPQQSLQVGEPQHGVSVAKIQTFDAAGKPTGGFSPIPAVTVLPLPVVAGSQFTSVGVDPATGATLIHQGTVGKRVPVDACGDMVDGWQVTSQEVFTGGAGQSSASTYTYTIATQLGGMPIYEKVGPPANAATAAGSDTIELTLGQLHASKP
jgi:hypothetical protein